MSFVIIIPHTGKKFSRFSSLGQKFQLNFGGKLYYISIINCFMLQTFSVAHLVFLFQIPEAPGLNVPPESGVVDDLVSFLSPSDNDSLIFYELIHHARDYCL
jgi:hypothetical protein